MRRDLLRLGSGVAATALAGCTSVLFSGPTPLTINVMNWDASEHRVHVSLLKEDADERSDAFVFDEEYVLTARSGDPTVETDEDVIESRPYLVRTEIDGNVSDHYHFRPDCTGGEEPREELSVEVRRHRDDDDRGTGLYLEFNQNTCGRDSLFV